MYTVCILTIVLIIICVCVYTNYCINHNICAVVYTKYCTNHVYYEYYKVKRFVKCSLSHVCLPSDQDVNEVEIRSTRWIKCL